MSGYQGPLEQLAGELRRRGMPLLATIIEHHGHSKSALVRHNAEQEARNLYSVLMAARAER